MSKIFISHSSANNAEALALAAWLEQNGWDEYFLDVDPDQGLAPGERWQEALKLAAGRCEAVLFLISPIWLGSRHCQSEFLLAKLLGKKIFGVLIKPTSLDDLPKEMTAEWQLCDLVAGEERNTFSVRDPVGLEVSFAAAGLARLKTGLQKAGLDATIFAWPPAHDPERAPYRGLRPLEADDAAVFFGRDVALTRGLDELRSVRERGVEGMLVILGASGAGKSSYLRAGLWPRLTRDDRNFVPLPVMRPQKAAMTGPSGLVASLDAAFRERTIARSRAEIRNILRSSGGFVQLVSELQTLAQQPLGPQSPVPTVLVAIDQGEELFVSDGREEADELLAILGGALAAPLNRTGADAHRLIAVVAIRSDAYDRLQSEPRLTAVAQRPFNLSPIARGEFKEVITGPAQRAAKADRRLQIEPALTERLLQDAEGADALPLLAFVLERLYVDYGGDGVLSVADYDELGGVRGSIEAAVDAAFANHERRPVIPAAKTERERLLRKAFIPWLAGVDPDTGERRRRVARLEEIPADAAGVIERLIDVRLLTRDRRKVEGVTQISVVVEVAHEALLRQWPALMRWLDEDAEALKAIEAVRRAAAEWARQQRGLAWLVHGGERLEAAEILGQRPDLDQLLGAEGRAYLTECRAKDSAVHAREDAARAEREALLQKELDATQRLGQEQEARSRDAEVASFRWKQLYEEAERQRQLARMRELAAMALNQLHDDPECSVLLALEAVDAQHPPPEVQDAIRQALLFSNLRAVFQERTEINDASFSTDAKYIVLACADGLVRIREAASWKETQVLRGHAAAVKTARFSPDGRWLLTSGIDDTTRLWSLAGGASRVLAKATDQQAFSADSRYLVLAVASELRMWDLEVGKDFKTVASGNVKGVQVAPDGKSVYVLSYSGSDRVKITSEQQIVTRSGYRVFEWQLRTKKLRLVARLKPGTYSAPDLWCLSPLTDRLGAGFMDNVLRIYSTGTGNELVTLRGHSERLTGAEFSDDGMRVATSSMDHTARVWDSSKGHTLAVLRGHRQEITAVRFSPDGDRVLTTSADRTLRVWSSLHTEVKTLQPGGTLNSVQFSPDGETILIAGIPDNSASGFVQLWDTGGAHRSLPVKAGISFSEARFSPDGRNIVGGGSNGLIQIWDTESSALLDKWNGYGGVTDVLSVRYTSDGLRLLTAGVGKVAELWDVATHKLLRRFAHQDRLSSADCSTDGTKIVTASYDKTARVWDAATGSELVRLEADSGGVLSAQFSPDGNWILTTGMDQVTRLWDTATYQTQVTFRGHAGRVSRAVFSPSGTQIITASSDGTARLWDAATGRELAVLRGHTGEVSSADFSPDGRYLITAGWDGSTRIYFVHLDDLIGLARTRVTRELTPEERARFLLPDGRLRRDTVPAGPFAEP